MRVVGNGDIGKLLKAKIDPKKPVTFFASGVSNSQETRQKEFLRELNLLKIQPQTDHLVYFSTLSVYYKDSPYTRHKRQMEMAIQVFFPKYTIVRIGNITWGTNPNTLINYLKAHPKAELRDEWRYIVDEDEFLYWIGMIPPWSCELNIPGKRMKVKEVYEQYCRSDTNRS